jgi:phage baseplate assembly protein W
MAVKISRAFKDISLSFTRHPITNDITVIKNEDAIKKSVINLCKTRLYERFFNPLLGSSIENSLFELFSDETLTFLEKEIRTLIQNYEPRVNLLSVILDSEEDAGELYIKLTYQIVGLPVPQQNIEFVLQPSRV